MTRKGQPTLTPTPAAPAAGSKAQPTNAGTKNKKTAKTPQPPQTMTKKALRAANGPASTKNTLGASSNTQMPKPHTASKKKKTKNTETPKQLLQSREPVPTLRQGGESSGSSNLAMVYPLGSSIKIPMSVLSLPAVGKCSDANAPMDVRPSDQLVKSHCSTSATEAPSNINEEEIFRLAAATPVPISPVLERQFYESQLLLYVREKIRGDHSKRQNYHGELDQDSTELRRSFVDKLAYICDFRKGGSTVTALALQKTYQGVTFWLAANETVKPKVIDFLQKILQTLKQAGEGVTRKALEKQLMAQIVPFNEERLNYYWSALDKNLNLCIQRLEMLHGTADGKPSQKELAALKNLLGGLHKLSIEKVELVMECFNARKSKVFETLSQLTGSGKANSKFFDDIRHLLGRLGEQLKAAKTLVSAALRFPAILDDFEIQIRASPPSRCYFQSSEDITLDGMASRIFSKDADIVKYQEALENLERISNGALFGRLKEECCFKTRVHAELLLLDLFYWKQFEFLDDDSYIGCSKPACYNCFHYILAHPGNFILPACHNKLYLAWRTPDILDENVSATNISRIREAITNKMNSNARAELRRQIDGRCARKSRHYDSVTGTSSSIPDGSLRPLVDLDISQDGSDSVNQLIGFPRAPILRSLLSHPIIEIDQADDSDDDLNWYKSRVERVRLI